MATFLTTCLAIDSCIPWRADAWGCLRNSVNTFPVFSLSSRVHVDTVSMFAASKSVPNAVSDWTRRTLLFLQKPLPRSGTAFLRDVDQEGGVSYVRQHSGESIDYYAMHA